MDGLYYMDGLHVQGEQDDTLRIVVGRVSENPLRRELYFHILHD